MNASTSYTPVIGRLLLAALFLLSGIGKLFAPAAIIGYISSVGLPLPGVAYALALVVEIGAGLMLIAGYQTRAAALALAVYTVAAAILLHNQFADQNQFIHFMKNLAIAGGLLQVATYGAGRLSVDARRAVTA